MQGDVGVRPFRLRDAQPWSEARIRNEDWLSPWEGRQPGLPDAPWEEGHSPGAFAAMLRGMRRESRAGRQLPFAVMVNGSLVGQVTVSNVVRGAFQSASVGYWVDREVAGRGVMPTALGLVVDHCLTVVGLHRIEANIRPENGPSLRVVRKLGFREEGLHPRFLFIDGGWRDHLSFAVTVEDLTEPMVSRLVGLPGQ
ncbi:MAG: putative ribosomal-protein-alanine N-acetyltransferase [Frankiales bacterium]|nr:putative ribosomal-protein-alanine N-acetyltransferase [Frankiales bacterium]